ncbi:GreA/GreB family elongation factor [Ghiorsea bivora]|uniref:GreA/GreB family elongation factor n=1 Tax=Ghiorsea bivora TaxID=1485545 RepID=UPI000571C344|nr:GreA/GreB family elongation factor [Ghiorsea bivora]
MNKQSVINHIITQLEANISVAQQAVDVARDTATHKDCLGSSKYETMGTEASYLAKGQGERLLELQRALACFKQLSPQPCTTAKLVSLVTLEDEQGKSQTLLLAGDAGGLKVEAQGTTITVITPQSPLGRSLMGKSIGDDIELKISGKTNYFEVIDVA